MESSQTGNTLSFFLENPGEKIFLASDFKR